MSGDQIFATLRAARRIWAVASIHGEADRLAALHRALGARFLYGDRLVYLGNILGRGARVRETVDEVLAFRRALLAQPGLFSCDIAYLRGSQEEMWQKLLQLQMAPNPGEVFRWMIEQGVGATLEAYGGNVRQGADYARQGAVGITRWTNALRASVREAPGHAALMSSFRRAAFTAPGEPGAALLFVSAGVNTTLPLSAQSDSFWWGSPGFSDMPQPYDGFRLVVRGFDPKHRGVRVGGFTAGIDAGCGFGGPLVAACFDREGEIVDVIEA
jgi:hypothetical protein